MLAVSLLLSWILALVHVPLMADTMMKGPKYEKVEGISGEEGLYNGWIYRALRKSLGFGEIAAYVEVHDVVVVACVVSEQRCSAGIVEETLQSLGWRQQLMMKALLDNGVGNVSQHLWNMAVGRYIHAKFRARDNSSVVHLHCSYQQDVVLVDVQSRGLGIEDYNIALGSLGEALYIALAVTAQQVRWCHGP